MNLPRERLSIPILMLVLAGCVTQPANLPQATSTSLPSTASEAHEALIEFFSLLNAGKYAEAELLYGGSYEGLQGNNPGVEPSDHVQLLKNACEINGNKCFLVHMAAFQELRGAIYIFQVEFSNPDGSLFVRSPCCGANVTDMPPEAQFEYRVARNAVGKFLVMDLPPYVP